MLVKILDPDLIRSFGSSIIEMSDSQAKKYINKNKAKEHNPNLNNETSKEETKRINHPNEDKMVWSPPEQKIFDSSEKIEHELSVYPKKDDPLFPQIEE